MNDQYFLSQIVERIERIISFTAGGKVVFLATPLIQDAVIRNFAVIDALSDRVSLALPWGQIAGFRDSTLEIDLEEVWGLVDQDLAPLEAEARRSLVVVAGT